MKIDTATAFERYSARMLSVRTERAVFRLTAEGPLLVEVAPGVDVERDIRGRLGFPLRTSLDVRPMDARLFGAAPMGLAAEWIERTPEPRRAARRFGPGRVGEPA